MDSKATDRAVDIKSVIDGINKNSIKMKISKTGRQVKGSFQYDVSLVDEKDDDLFDGPSTTYMSTVCFKNGPWFSDGKLKDLETAKAKGEKTFKTNIVVGTKTGENFGAFIGALDSKNLWKNAVEKHAEQDVAKAREDGAEFRAMPYNICKKTLGSKLHPAPGDKVAAYKSAADWSTSIRIRGMCTSGKMFGFSLMYVDRGADGRAKTVPVEITSINVRDWFSKGNRGYVFFKLGPVTCINIQDDLTNYYFGVNPVSFIVKRVNPVANYSHMVPADEMDNLVSENPVEQEQEQEDAEDEKNNDEGLPDLESVSIDPADQLVSN